MPLNRSTAGIALGVAAYGTFALHDAAIKWLVVDVPVWQILFFRSVTVLIGCLAIGRGALVRRLIDTPLKAGLAFRGAVNLVAWLCFYTASASLPLGQLICLYFAAPAMITVMAWRLLRERVTAARWLSVGVGFVGVLFASDPFGVHASLATLLVLIAAALWGYSVILTRRIIAHEKSTLLMAATNGIFTIVTGAVCLAQWQPVSWSQAPGLAGVGVLGGLAQFLVFESARLVPASVLAPVEYSALPWAFFLGFLIWHDIPTAPVFAGAALIVGAGTILVRAERGR